MGNNNQVSVKTERPENWVRLACRFCDTEEFDHVTVDALFQCIEDGWRRVSYRQTYEEATATYEGEDEEAPPDFSLFDWYTHMGTCPECDSKQTSSLSSNRNSLATMEQIIAALNSVDSNGSYVRPPGFGDFASVSPPRRRHPRSDINALMLISKYNDGGGYAPIVEMNDWYIVFNVSPKSLETMGITVEDLQSLCRSGVDLDHESDRLRLGL